MNIFYTVTDEGTEHTNSRSSRMDYDSAIECAKARIRNSRTKSVIILKAIQRVCLEHDPSIIVENLEESRPKKENVHLCEGGDKCEGTAV